MVVVQEAGQAQREPCVLLKGGNAGHETSAVAVGRPDVVQYVLCRLLLQLDIAALGRRDESVLDLPGDAAGGVGEQRGEFVLEIIFSVCLTDEVENGQAFFILS